MTRNTTGHWACFAGDIVALGVNVQILASTNLKDNSYEPIIQLTSEFKCSTNSSYPNFKTKNKKRKKKPLYHFVQEKLIQINSSYFLEHFNYFSFSLVIEVSERNMMHTSFRFVGKYNTESRSGQCKIGIHKLKTFRLPSDCCVLDTIIIIIILTLDTSN